MKKTMLLVAAFLCANQVQANQVDIIVDFAMQQFKQSGQLSAAASCVGNTEKNVLNTYKASMKHCMSKYGFNEEGESALSMCMQEQVVTGLNITPEQERCLEALDEQELANEDAKFDNMSDAEFKEYAQNQRDQALKQIEAISKITQEASKGTESTITLPVYRPSTIMSHYSDGFPLDDGDKGLPIAMLSSEADFQKIVAFYKEQLPNFDKKVFDGDMVIFMKNMPSDFDPIENLTLLQKTPHVSIYKISGANKTNIEISYKK